jgi:hypothetical protein
MRHAWFIVLVTTVLAIASDGTKEHRDYVPDQKTAEKIAEAVLVAQYGEQRVTVQLPLLIDGSNSEYWIVQVAPRTNGMPSIGGGPAVWINKHSGCLKVMDHMK